MNFASFIISIDESITFLKEQGLFKGRGIKTVGDHSEEFKKACRKNRHTDIFAIAIENKDYEILLTDDSVFQFSFEKDALRYAFIQNPNLFVSKEDYLGAIYTPEDLLQFSDEEIQGLLSSIKDEEYEQYFNEQDINLKSNIIRYDLDAKGYSPLVHAYSHVHFGLNENLRIPCSKILTPLKFSILAVKNTYYTEWKKAFARNLNLETLIKESKKRCTDLPVDYWIHKEKYELYLN
jgi:hypothetical protein